MTGRSVSRTAPTATSTTAPVTTPGRHGQGQHAEHPDADREQDEAPLSRPRRAISGGSTAEPATPATTMISSRTPAADSETPAGSSRACSQVVRAMNTPKPTQTSPTSRRICVSAQTARRGAGRGGRAGGAPPAPAHGRRPSAAAASTVRTACTSSNAPMWPAPSTAPSTSARSMPAKMPADDTASPVVWSRRAQEARRHRDHRVEHQRLGDGDQHLPGQHGQVVDAGEPQHGPAPRSSAAPMPSHSGRLRSTSRPAGRARTT